MGMWKSHSTNVHTYLPAVHCIECVAKCDENQNLKEPSEKRLHQPSMIDYIRRIYFIFHAYSVVCCSSTGTPKIRSLSLFWFMTFVFSGSIPLAYWYIQTFFCPALAPIPLRFVSLPPSTQTNGSQIFHEIRKNNVIPIQWANLSAIQIH